MGVLLEDAAERSEDLFKHHRWSARHHPRNVEPRAIEVVAGFATTRWGLDR
jgi:hypothetical protein